MACRYGYLEQNFDRTLLQLFSEVAYWEKLRFEIPYVAMDIATHRERYRCLRENVMLVVREYNQILKALSPQERTLPLESAANAPLDAELCRRVPLLILPRNAAEFAAICRRRSAASSRSGCTTSTARSRRA